MPEGCRDEPSVAFATTEPEEMELVADAAARLVGETFRIREREWVALGVVPGTPLELEVPLAPADPAPVRPPAARLPEPGLLPGRPSADRGVGVGGRTRGARSGAFVHAGIANRAARWLFHQMTVKAYVYTPASGHRGPERDLASARKYLDRFGDQIDVAGKRVLDVGCGNGQLCFELARRGASRVVGMDIGGELAQASLDEQPPEIRRRVEIVRTDGMLSEVAPGSFDRVFSKDSFEHFDRPELVVGAMIRALAPGGQLVIGFGPLWKAPTGGHMGYMTRLPWAHLLFPEEVIMAERRRFRPDEDASCFAEIKCGLNKMTLARFTAIMASTGLRCRSFETNVSSNPIVRMMAVLAAVPPLREYFTANVYGIWEVERQAPRATRPAYATAAS